MTTQEAVSLYGTKTRLAEALGIEQSAVSMWGEYPPPLRQLQIAKLPRAVRAGVKAESNVFTKKRKAA